MSVAIRNSNAEPRAARGMLTRRGGLTLIELLVVIIIMTTVVAAAIPIMAPADDDRRMRETSRSLNTFLTVAQSRAIANNRPFGVGLKRLSQDTGRAEDRGVCVQVFLVEQPPAFTGFDENSAAMVALDNGPTGGAGQVLIRFVTRDNLSPQNNDRLPPGWDPDPLPPGTIRRGDVVVIAGTHYQLIDDSAAFLDENGFYKQNAGNPVGTLVAVPLNDRGQMLNVRYNGAGNEIATANVANLPYWTPPERYKILRQPTPTADAPFQMPDGTAVDLRASGLGYYDYFYWPTLNDNDVPVMILFSPEGKVSRLRYTKGYDDGSNNPTLQIFDEPVADDLYLLVGRRENIPAPAPNRDKTLDASAYGALRNDDDRQRARSGVNWLLGSSRWIVVGSQSGRVATVGNTFVDPLAVLNDPNPIIMADDPEEVRALQIIASRELIRETTQETGR